MHNKQRSDLYQHRRTIATIKLVINKAYLMDLIAATGLAILLKNWIQVVDFSARVTLKFDG